MSRKRSFIVDINNSKFNILGKRKKELDLSGIETLRHLLSNKRVKILNSIKNDKPKSIYMLAKILERDIKAIRKDLRLLERFELIDLISEKTGERKQLRPVLSSSNVEISIKL